MKMLVTPHARAFRTAGTASREYSSSLQPWHLSMMTRLDSANPSVKAKDSEEIFRIFVLARLRYVWWCTKKVLKRRPRWRTP